MRIKSIFLTLLIVLSLVTSNSSLSIGQDSTEPTSSPVTAAEVKERQIAEAKKVARKIREEVEGLIAQMASQVKQFSFQAPDTFEE